MGSDGIGKARQLRCWWLLELRGRRWAAGHCCGGGGSGVIVQGAFGGVVSVCAWLVLEEDQQGRKT